MNKEEIKEVIKKLQKGDNFNYYTNYGYAYSLLISDADTIIDYFEEMEQENKELHNKIDKAIEVINKMIYQGYMNGNIQYFATSEKSEFGIRANVILEILKDSDVDEDRS